MKKLFLFGLSATILCLALYGKNAPVPETAEPTTETAQVGVDVEFGGSDDDDDDDVQYVWIGPGWYYGVWFDNEYAYDGWYRDHYRHHRHHHGHHNHHHRGHGGHHGGGHHGGHHGGGHHGGGHGGGHHR